MFQQLRRCLYLLGLITIPNFGFAQPTRYDLGFYRVSSASPKIYLGNPIKNSEEHLRIANQADLEEVDLLVFPELSLVGYTSEDLLHHPQILRASREAVAFLAQHLPKQMTVIVGAPWVSPDQKLYNVGIVLKNGKIQGIVPKVHRPNYREFYEQRYFASGEDLDIDVNDPEFGKFKLSRFQIFNIGQMRVGVEICEDSWAPHTPSTELALNGANTLVNLSASPELVGKKEYRTELVQMTSARLLSAMVYSSSGPWESSKDLVFSGHQIITESGRTLAESNEINFNSNLLTADIDIELIDHDRHLNSTFRDTHFKTTHPVQTVNLGTRLNAPLVRDLKRLTSADPFSAEDMVKRGKDIIEIVAAGLTRRLLTTGSKKMVLGLSGGRDSTLALLFMLRAQEIIANLINSDQEVAALFDNKQPQIHAITMPGFGTSEETFSASHQLAKAFNVELREVPIGSTSNSLLADIGHDGITQDIAYENAQARVRTAVLFQVANAEHGLVIGTGDLSELCLGWCTYNGDHMSHYGVNAGIPKTLVNRLIQVYATHYAKSVDQKQVLESILKQEISPELTTDKTGAISQKTEDIIGKYEILDFIIFHVLRNGFSSEKIRILAADAFEGTYTIEQIDFALKSFNLRFARNQFKRDTAPAGVMVGSVAVSPRGYLRLPSELECAISFL